MPDRRRVSLLALALLAALGGCGDSRATPVVPSALLDGADGPIPLARIESARTIAARFADAYAESIYDPSPSPLPGAIPRVNRAIRSAAARIPPPRIGRRASARALTFVPEPPSRIRCAVTISDSSSPPFSVGFTLRSLPNGWRVTSISPPG
jgi:hypothetical protein